MADGEGIVHFGAGAPLADPNVYTDGDLFVDIEAPALYAYRTLQTGPRWHRATPDARGLVADAIAGLPSAYLTKVDAARTYATASAFQSRAQMLSDRIDALASSKASVSWVQSAIETARGSVISDLRSCLFTGYVDRDEFTAAMSRVAMLPTSAQAAQGMSYVRQSDLDRALAGYIRNPGAALLGLYADGSDSDLSDADADDLASVRRFMDALSVVHVVRRSGTNPVLSALDALARVGGMSTDLDRILGLYADLASLRASETAAKAYADGLSAADRMWVQHTLLPAWRASEGLLSGSDGDFWSGFATSEQMASALGRISAVESSKASAADLYALANDVVGVNYDIVTAQDGTVSQVPRGTIGPRLLAVESAIAASSRYVPQEERTQIIEASVAALADHSAPVLDVASDGDGEPGSTVQLLDGMTHVHPADNIADLAIIKRGKAYGNGVFFYPCDAVIPVVYAIPPRAALLPSRPVQGMWDATDQMLVAYMGAKGGRWTARRFSVLFDQAVPRVDTNFDTPNDFDVTAGYGDQWYSIVQSVVDGQDPVYHLVAYSMDILLDGHFGGRVVDRIEAMFEAVDSSDGDMPSFVAAPNTDPKALRQIGNRVYVTLFCTGSNHQVYQQYFGGSDSDGYSDDVAQSNFDGTWPPASYPVATLQKYAGSSVLVSFDEVAPSVFMVSVLPLAVSAGSGEDFSDYDMD